MDPIYMKQAEETSRRDTEQASGCRAGAGGDAHGPGVSFW